MSKIVLTAPATEMSDFKQNPFIAFTTSFPSRMIPLSSLKHKIWYSPAEKNPDGTVKFAPNGLRKIEAKLLENGFSESDIAVVHPFDLDRFVGPETKVVGVSCMESMGLAYVSTTYSSFMNLGGRSMNADEFHKLMSKRCLRKYKPKIIVGGAGSWQIERLGKREKYGIDTVIIGEADSIVVDIFRKAVKGEKTPSVVHGRLNDIDDVPTIRHASMHGCTEITRGCGRGCQFCAPTMRRKISFPLDKIIREVKVNVRGGSGMIMLASDDAFLYGAKQGVFEPNSTAVLKLFRSVSAVEGVESIQPAHISLAPAKANPKLISEVSEEILQKAWLNYRGKPYVTAETGVETGSVRLMKKYMKGKALPYSVDNWPEIVSECIGILNDNNWYPLITMITGFPGENEKDRMDTLELLDELRHAKIYYAPLFFVPLEECVLNRFSCDLSKITESQWEFFARCWRHNIRMWTPSLRKYASTIGQLSYYMYYKWKYGSVSKRAIDIVSGK